MNNKRKNIIKVLLPFIAVPLLILGFYIYTGYLYKIVLPCPTWTFLHIYCPGCGGTRSIHALLEGNIVSALRCNALVPAAVLIFLLYWVENVLALFGRNVKIIPRSRAFIITASGIIIAYSVLRNFIPIIQP